MASSTANGPTALDNTSTKDSFIPLFSGQPSEYKEWRKRITIYHHKMAISKRSAESILNIIGSMQGTAWRLLEDFPLENVEKDGTFEEILKILDRSFQYDERVQLPADFDSYYNLQRKAGQTLLGYVSEHDEALKKIEKHKVILPTEVQGWHLLTKSSLSREQRQLVTLRAPRLEKEKVQEAMFLILGQDKHAAADGRRNYFHRGRGSNRAFAAHDEVDDDFGFHEDYDDESVYYQEEAWDLMEPELDDADFDWDAGYYQYDGEDGSPQSPHSAQSVIPMKTMM